MQCEVYFPGAAARWSRKAITWLREFSRISRGVKLTPSPSGLADFLVVYGALAPQARNCINVYREQGKPWVSLDLGYWDRVAGDYALRVSINAIHPQEHLDDFGAQRWDDRNISLIDTYNPNGHAVLAGCGKKYMQTRAEEQDWDHDCHLRARRRFKTVIFRPKPQNKAHMARFPIRPLFDGACYLITHHSNAAIDAIICGLPVSTVDGAARWLYDDSFENEPVSDDLRLEFLRRLAWWNWRPSEMSHFWDFILERVEERKA